MRLRKFLLVHQNPMIRNIIKRQLLSEYGDIDVTDVETYAQGLHELEMHKYGMVLAGELLNDGRGVALCKELSTKSEWTDVPFLMIVESVPRDQLESYKDQGVHHFIKFPSKTTDLKLIIDGAYNSRALRAHDRYNIPDTKVVIHVDRHDIEADLINISQGGLLCEWTYDDHPFNVFISIMISLRVPGPDGYTEIPRIRCRIPNMSIVSWVKNEIPDKIRISLFFSELDEATKGLLVQLLEMAKERQLYK